MEWIQIFIIVLFNFAFHRWSNSEREDDNKEIMRLLKEIDEEMKRFHIRVQAIEDKKKR